MSDGKCCDLDDFLRAMADENRQSILSLLQPGEMNVAELTEALGLKQPTVSHHLVVMLRAGLVFRRREGRQSFYRPNPACVADCCSEILTRYRIPVGWMEPDASELMESSREA